MSDPDDTRLIERWLPIAELGIESVRERTPLTPFPAPNRLHVWWARRPLVASRAAVLASLLPATTDHDEFKEILGILGDPVASRRRIDEAKRNGVRFNGDAYSYKRAFTHVPSEKELTWISKLLEATGSPIVVLDPTAGGGAIPFEALSLGFDAIANDINPVAALILRLTIDAPRRYGSVVLDEFRRLADRYIAVREERLASLYPAESEPRVIPTNYLWARTIMCCYCDGLVPLSPSWQIAPDGTGVRLLPQIKDGPNTPGRVCRFEIRRTAEEHGAATFTGGDAKCPYPDCGRVISGDELKRQAQSGGMGDQLYVIVFKRRLEGLTKAGKPRQSWVRGYRAPAERDNILHEIERRLAEKLPVWEARDIIPSEAIPEGNKTSEPVRYGMKRWRDLFNPRQLYVHCTSVEIYHELLAEERKLSTLTPGIVAAFGYLALAIDKMLNYNARICRWHTNRELTVGVFDRHDFSFYTSYAEMVPLVVGVGYDWAINQTGKSLEDLIELSSDNAAPLIAGSSHKSPTVVITCENASRLVNVPDLSVDAVVIDPPYGANVMYAELSDFFYVWLKRTAGLVYPELFRTKLTDKQHEAVANPARFEGQRGAMVLAESDYRNKMEAIFSECRRVLKPTGIMTLMFTHKATGAWDALARGLIESGFVITASWPINTESGSSLHIREKAAANSTIFLVCRPRMNRDNAAPAYWDDLERRVRSAVRSRIEEFQTAGIRGVDLYLASFGPALQVLSEHWPVQRIAPRPASIGAKPRRRGGVEQAPIDPYAVTPEDALDAARTEVKRWRLEHLSRLAAREGLDAETSWFVLAWDAFESAVFPYDEALRLAHVCGVSLDADIVGHYAAKKGENLVIWDSSIRAAKHALGMADGNQSMLDAVHHAAYLARTRSLDAARSLLEEQRLDKRPSFLAAFDAIRQVLPVSADYSGLELPAAAVGAGDDFRALENIRKLLYATELPPPQQLALLTVPK